MTTDHPAALGGGLTTPTSRWLEAGSPIYPPEAEQWIDERY